MDRPRRNNKSYKSKPELRSDFSCPSVVPLLINKVFTHKPQGTGVCQGDFSFLLTVSKGDKQTLFPASIDIDVRYDLYIREKI